MDNLHFIFMAWFKAVNYINQPVKTGRPIGKRNKPLNFEELQEWKKWENEKQTLKIINHEYVNFLKYDDIKFKDYIKLTPYSENFIIFTKNLTDHKNERNISIYLYDKQKRQIYFLKSFNLPSEKKEYIRFVDYLSKKEIDKYFKYE